MSKHNGATESPAKAVARSMRELSHDVITLGELQAQLLLSELRQWRSDLVMPAVLLVIATFVALGSVPVLLLSLAFVLVEFATLSQSVSHLIAALAGMALAGFMAAVGWRKLGSTSVKLERSQVEFQHNLRWIKRVLRNTGNPPETPAATGRCQSHRSSI